MVQEEVLPGLGDGYVHKPQPLRRADEPLHPCFSRPLCNTYRIQGGPLRRPFPLLSLPGSRRYGPRAHFLHVPHGAVQPVRGHRVRRRPLYRLPRQEGKEKGQHAGYRVAPRPLPGRPMGDVEGPGAGGGTLEDDRGEL